MSLTRLIKNKHVVLQWVIKTLQDDMIYPKFCPVAL